MMRRMITMAKFRLCIAGGSLLLLGGCGLSDSQLTGILQSLILTGLTGVLNAVLAGLLPASGTA